MAASIQSGQMPAAPPASVLAAHAVLLIFLIVLLLWLRRWPVFYIALVWPGTLAHEALHYIAGLLTGARPMSFSVLPRRSPEGGWILGSVTFARLCWWNSLPVGLAPLTLIPVGLGLFVYSASWPELSATSGSWKFAAAQCLIAGSPSAKDWAHAIPGLMILTAISVGAIWLLRAWA